MRRLKWKWPTAEIGPLNESPITRDVNTVEELDSCLDELSRDARAKESPIIVVMEAEDGTYFSLGVGLLRSVLVYVASMGSPHFHSVASDDPGTDDLVFAYMGQHSDYPPESGVTNVEARQAARLFLKASGKPDNVTWAED